MNEQMDEDGADAICETLAGGAWPTAPETAEFRAALLAQTTGIVRRRARWRRGRPQATNCQAYAAGVLTMIVVWRLPAPGDGRADPLAVQPGPRESRTLPRDLPAPTANPAAREQPSPKPADELASLSPAELRRLVPHAPREKQLRLLALAGDRYLFNQADVDSALDCS